MRIRAASELFSVALEPRARGQARPGASPGPGRPSCPTLTRCTPLLSPTSGPPRRSSTQAACSPRPRRARRWQGAAAISRRRDRERATAGRPQAGRRSRRSRPGPDLGRAGAGGEPQAGARSRPKARQSGVDYAIIEGAAPRQCGRRAGCSAPARCPRCGRRSRGLRATSARDRRSGRPRTAGRSPWPRAPQEQPQGTAPAAPLSSGAPALIQTPVSRWAERARRS